jgi:hypothetical protein
MHILSLPQHKGDSRRNGTGMITERRKMTDRKEMLEPERKKTVCNR